MLLKKKKKKPKKDEKMQPPGTIPGVNERIFAAEGLFIKSLSLVLLKI
jgi:hypothetical protein